MEPRSATATTTDIQTVSTTAVIGVFCVFASAAFIRVEHGQEVTTAWQLPACPEFKKPVKLEAQLMSTRKHNCTHKKYRYG